MDNATLVNQAMGYKYASKLMENQLNWYCLIEN